MKKILFIVLCIIAASPLHAQLIGKLDPPLPPGEEAALDTIIALPEVKDRAFYIEKETKGERHMLVWMYMEPQDDYPYYWVKAGEDNGETFVTHFNFLISPRTMNIYYLDTLEDEKISLDEWRKRNKK